MSIATLLEGKYLKAKNDATKFCHHAILKIKGVSVIIRIGSLSVAITGQTDVPFVENTYFIFSDIEG